MKSIISILRDAALYLLFFVKVIGICSEPDDSSKSWVADFFVSKGIGFAAGLAAWKLHDKWSRAYDLGKEGEDL